MMSSPPTPPEWTLNAANISGGNNGRKLVGCHIIQNATNYQFTKPDLTVLATYSATGPSGPILPTTAFTFPSFNYKDIDGWVIGMSTPPASTADWPSCSWSTPGDVQIKDTTPESGDFTAQTGGTVPDEAADKAASSAKAY